METNITPIVGLLKNYLPLAGGTMTGDITMSGADILLGANKIKTTNCLIRESATGHLLVRNFADDDYKDISAHYIRSLGGFYNDITPSTFNAHNVDDGYVILKTRDNGVGLVEIARLVGAADPYFQATLPMRLNPTAAALPAVEGMIGYNSGDDTLRLRRAADEVSFRPANALTTVIDTTWVAAAPGAGEVTKLDITGRGTARVYFYGDGDAAAGRPSRIYTDGTKIVEIQANVEDEYSVSFNVSLKVTVLGDGANNHSGGEIKGNYHT